MLYFSAAPSTSLFGSQQNAGTMFGAQQTNTGFGGFGAQQPQVRYCVCMYVGLCICYNIYCLQQQGIGLFGQNKAATPFGLGNQQQPAVSTGFGFAQNTVNNTQGKAKGETNVL